MSITPLPGTLAPQDSVLFQVGGDVEGVRAIIDLLSPASPDSSIRLNHSSLCNTAGQAYLHALGNLYEILPCTSNSQIVCGGLGKQLAELHDWLYGEPSPPLATPSTNRRQSPRLRGIDVSLTAEQVLDLAQRRLLKDAKGSTYYHSWYVLVGGQPIAAKWIASQITGLPVSTFTAGEARRLLTQLGIQVMRVGRTSMLKPGCLEQ